MTFVGSAISKAIPILADFFRELFFWPSSVLIKKCLPLGFRMRYTSREYKKCNTLKYLIYITPHGFINFISIGFGGWISDKSILEKSGYLEAIPRNIAVMADRGFKHVVAQLICKTVCLNKISSFWLVVFSNPNR